MSELSHGQIIALSHHLTEYPDDVSFAHICGMLEDDSDEVVICDAFTMWETDYLIDMMSSLSSHIDTVIVESHKEPEDEKNNASTAL